MLLRRAFLRKPSHKPKHEPSHTIRHKSTSSNSTIRQRLKELSQRTGTDPISLSASFAILHELTAIVPIFAIFGGLHWMGAGERSLEYIWGASASDAANGSVRSWLRGACEEGERRLDRLRQRYDLWQDEQDKWDGSGRYTAQISEAIAAYAITKVCIILTHNTNLTALKLLLPVRIFASLYYSPRFSTLVFEPLKRFVRR